MLVRPNYDGREAVRTAGEAIGSSLHAGELALVVRIAFGQVA